MPFMFQKTWSIRRAADNGRTLQDLLVQAGLRYVKALKRGRKIKATQKKSTTKRENG